MDLAFVTNDIGTLLNEIGRDVTLRKVSKTKDTYGRTTAKSNTDTTVKGYIHAISEDRPTQKPVGWMEGKDYIGIFKVGSDVEIHDRIVDGSDIYEVQSIMAKPNLAGTTFFIRVKLRKTDG